MSFHTFELSFELTDNYRNVKEALHKCGCKNYKDKREKTPTHVFEVYPGLVAYIKKVRQGDYTHNMLYYRINPRRLTDDNNYVGLFDAARSGDMLDKVDKILNRIYSDMPLTEECMLSRIDFCCNACLESADEVDFYIDLFKRGALHDTYEIQKYKNDVAKRKVLSKNGITYIGKNDVNIVFYNKQREMEQQNLTYRDVDYLNRIIRIEIQCKRAKIKRICRRYDIHGVREFLENSDEIGLPVMRKYAGIFCGVGDFCKEKAIVKEIDSSAYKNKTKELMKELVSLSAKHSSLDKAVKKLNEKYGADRILKIRQKFNELNISPVVIPRRAQYKRLPGTDTLIGHF